MGRISILLIQIEEVEVAAVETVVRRYTTISNHFRLEPKPTSKIQTRTLQLVLEVASLMKWKISIEILQLALQAPFDREPSDLETKYMTTDSLFHPVKTPISKCQMPKLPLVLEVVL